jgi:hypothetical protein
MALSVQTAKRERFLCEGCGVPVDRKRNNSNRRRCRPRFCGLACRDAALRALNTQRRAENAGLLPARRMWSAWARRVVAIATIVTRCVRRARRGRAVLLGAPYQFTCAVCSAEEQTVVRRVHAARRKMCDRCQQKQYIVFGKNKWGRRARAYLREGHGEAAAAAVFLRRLHLMINGQEAYR